MNILLWTLFLKGICCFEKMGWMEELSSSVESWGYKHLEVFLNFLSKSPQVLSANFVRNFYKVSAKSCGLKCKIRKFAIFY